MKIFLSHRGSPAAGSKICQTCVLPRVMRCCEYQNLVVTKCFIQHFFCGSTNKKTRVYLPCLSVSNAKSEQHASIYTGFWMLLFLQGLWMLNLKLNLVGRFRYSEAVDQRDCNCNDPFVANEEWPWLQTYWYWTDFPNELECTSETSRARDSWNSRWFVAQKSTYVA